MRKAWYLGLGGLVIVNLLVWVAVFSYTGDELTIIACDVGQGDAFLVTRRDFQILIDGGPNNKVLQCLSGNMPFWDRVVDVVVLSHPQKDHFAGLIDVFQNYQVNYFMTTPLDSGSQEWRVLEDLVGGGGVRVINPLSGQKYRSGLIYLDILHPSEAFLAENLTDKNNDISLKKINNSAGVLGAYSTKKDPNEFSVALILSYKEFDALFTGDVGPEISDVLAEEYISNGSRSIEYIKIPHHGSKNGLTQSLLDAVKPKIAVISVGGGNSYGHPHKEIISLLSDRDIKTLRTDRLGEVGIVTNGEAWWVK